MSKTKWFRVAVEGATASDGRTIEKSWLTDIAETYNPQTYGARVNLEHIRGVTGAAPFKAYGDVTAVKTEMVTLKIGGKDVSKLALFAQIDPTADLVAMTKDRQKIYTSIEVAPDFAKSGKAGLVGLGVTDSPASLGTDILAFSATNPALKAMFDSRKTDPANMFSAAEETVIELEAEPEKVTGAFDTFAAAVALFLKQDKKPDPVVTPAPAPAPTGDFAEALAGVQTAITKSVEAMATKLDRDRAADRDAFAKLQGEVTALKTTIDITERLSTPRPGSTGGAGGEQADY